MSAPARSSQVRVISVSGWGILGLLESGAGLEHALLVAAGPAVAVRAVAAHRSGPGVDGDLVQAVGAGRRDGVDAVLVGQFVDAGGDSDGAVDGDVARRRG